MRSSQFFERSLRQKEKVILRIEVEDRILPCEKEDQKDDVGSVVKWLKHRTDNQHDLGSKPTCAILLCPWERHFTALSPAWWSWQAALNYSNISTKLQASWHLRKQVGVIAYPMY